MQRDGLVRSFGNLKDYCPQPSTTPSYEAFGQSHFCFYSMHQEDAGAPSPLARGNAALHHKTRFEHTLDGACRRLFDPAKHHVDSVLGKHGHVLLDRGQSRLEQGIGGAVVVAHYRVVTRHTTAALVQTLEQAKAALEGPALGVAILAGVGTGVYPSVESACDAIVKPDTVLYPDAERSRAYEPYYRLYLRQYPALRETFHALAAMRSRA